MTAEKGRKARRARRSADQYNDASSRVGISGADANPDRPRPDQGETERWPAGSVKAGHGHGPSVAEQAAQHGTGWSRSYQPGDMPGAARSSIPAERWQQEITPGGPQLTSADQAAQYNENSDDQGGSDPGTESSFGPPDNDRRMQLASDNETPGSGVGTQWREDVAGAYGPPPYGGSRRQMQRERPMTGWAHEITEKAAGSSHSLRHRLASGAVDFSSGAGSSGAVAQDHPVTPTPYGGGNLSQQPPLRGVPQETLTARGSLTFTGHAGTVTPSHLDLRGAALQVNDLTHFDSPRPAASAAGQQSHIAPTGSATDVRGSGPPLRGDCFPCGQGSNVPASNPFTALTRAAPGERRS